MEKKGCGKVKVLGTGDRSSLEREFERLYSESYGIVYNYVRSRMNNDASAEDVVSETFLLAARSFSKFDPSRAKFITWVITIAKNCMVSYFRKERPTVNLEDLTEDHVAVQGGQEEVDDALLVQQMLRCLDSTERELVIAKYRDGKRNCDIAQELNMNASTVSTVLSRALSKMRSVAERGM